MSFFLCTFASEMQNKKINSLFAWVMVVAFVSMLVVKDYHGLLLHNESLGRHARCCLHSRNADKPIGVLDYQPLSEHEEHAHMSFVAFQEEEDDCAICHFLIAKILQVRYAFCGFTASFLGSMPISDYLFSLYTFLGHCPGRAPPVLI